MRAVVLRGGKLQVRETADPVPGASELLIKPLSAAICASDVHYMDHPNSADRFVWDSNRDTIMGHEFIGEVVGHDPETKTVRLHGQEGGDEDLADCAARSTLLHGGKVHVVSESEVPGGGHLAAIFWRPHARKEW